MAGPAHVTRTMAADGKTRSCADPLAQIAQAVMPSDAAAAATVSRDPRARA